MKKLRESPKSAERASYDALLRMVHSGASLRAPEFSNTRAILMEEGLLYRDPKTNEYAIPGTLIAQEIQRQEAPPQTAVDVRGTGEEAGMLIWGDASIELKGTAWRALKTLWDRRPQYVPLDDLKPDPRNSVQRLRDELGRRGCGHLIENKYRVGYRLITGI